MVKPALLRVGMTTCENRLPERATRRITGVAAEGSGPAG
jgi:hypothetical protein